jgi:hypothetical protein
MSAVTFVSLSGQTIDFFCPCYHRCESTAAVIAKAIDLSLGAAFGACRSVVGGCYQTARLQWQWASGERQAKDRAC